MFRFVKAYVSLWKQSRSNANHLRVKSRSRGAFMPIPLNQLLDSCKTAIEEKLGWGEVRSWKQRDYECLSKLIQEQTGISLSLSTLRRIWKPNYAATPHPSTLEALARFAGYESWHELQREANTREEEPREALDDRVVSAPEISVVAASAATAQADMPHDSPRGPVGADRDHDLSGVDCEADPSPQTAPDPRIRQPPPAVGMRRVILALATTMLFVLVYLAFNQSTVTSTSEVALPDVPFSHRKTVSQGLPNTVIFDFDISGLGDREVFIQQSWNPAERVRLSPSHRHHSAVYYYPGFHRARLLVNEQIVADRRVHVTTDGWLPLARYELRDPTPFYLPAERAVHDGMLHVSPEVLADARLDLSKNRYWVSYYNVRDFGQATGSDFRFEARLRNRLEEGGLTCQKSEVFVICENGFFLVPLAYPGCVSEITLRMPEVRMAGRDHDLSAFGCDLSDWRKLGIVADGGETTILVDDRPIFSHRTAERPGLIKGLQFRFFGCGAVDWVRLQDGIGRTVFEDDFP